jgi:hypothetical protein
VAANRQSSEGRQNYARFGCSKVVLSLNFTFGKQMKRGHHNIIQPACSRQFDFPEQDCLANLQG